MLTHLTGEQVKSTWLWLRRFLPDGDGIELTSFEGRRRYFDLSAGRAPLELGIFLSLGIMAFQSGTGNLGLISRQRVQFLPYLFMLFM